MSIFDNFNPKHPTAAEKSEGRTSNLYGSSMRPNTAFLGLFIVVLVASAAPADAAFCDCTRAVTESTGVQTNLTKLVQELWPNAQEVCLKNERLGVTDFASYSIVVGGQKMHIKIARSPQALEGQKFAEEVALARWASDAGFGPAVIFSDADAGILVSAFAEDAVADWNVGAQDPKLGAMIAFMARLHAFEMADDAQSIVPENLVAPVLDRLQQALSRAAYQTQLQRRIRLIAGALPRIAAQLNDASFVPARIHGDFHQNNFLYQSEGSVMVDWGRSTLADPMQELAYLSYFTDRGIKQLPLLVERYGGGRNTSLARARVYLVLLHASLFADEALGVEPARKMAQAVKLDYLWAFLQQDLSFFAGVGS